ncbi:bifunctional glutamate N-acetyltransferase/amino-acid acetyltransferase ArgJ [Candidatus Laterigemmans baculatus]|uniref:bifunctional glutamate N-acetyltransferase/amino-acid acetyltransferase ArgJ n=1 Tax=Candidatus Laterigemmans baculatus TaxID=2770505 RepID=UPI0013D902A9|nr:bifunctional glutamate N-acetyltransferase/amino-acid acetyltransferase ArgJ [Candidatus Laterigemmans baculatus]
MQLPSGFRFAGVTCGIKKSGKPDLTLVVADPGSVAAGVYTQNQVVAAPVVLSRSRTPGAIRAVVVNSGNANACTGQRGMEDAEQTTRWVAEAVGCEPSEVLVMSTGVIGHHLPMERISAGVAQASGELASDPDAFLRAADAILTTDQGRKIAARQSTLPGGETISLAGMAKGAGMIGPNMATMLGLVVTDLTLSAEDAQAALSHAADRSFNRISVEGHTSTNDTLVLLSSNRVGTAAQTKGAQTKGAQTDGDTLAAFTAALTEMCIELAKKIPADGEGATHVIEIAVRGAQTDASAAKIAKTIAESALVKTAITGGDPNWGRIVSAAGYAGEPIEPAAMALAIQGTQVYRDGAPVAFDAAAASAAIRSASEVRLELIVGRGAGEATFWTSDLTVDYVRFNSEYTT